MLKLKKIPNLPRMSWWSLSKSFHRSSGVSVWSTRGIVLKLSVSVASAKHGQITWMLIRHRVLLIGRRETSCRAKGHEASVLWSSWVIHEGGHCFIRHLFILHHDSMPSTPKTGNWKKMSIPLQQVLYVYMLFFPFIPYHFRVKKEGNSSTEADKTFYWRSGYSLSSTAHLIPSHPNHNQHTYPQCLLKEVSSVLSMANIDKYSFDLQVGVCPTG